MSDIRDLPHIENLEDKIANLSFQLEKANALIASYKRINLDMSEEIKELISELNKNVVLIDALEKSNKFLESAVSHLDKKLEEEQSWSNGRLTSNLKAYSDGFDEGYDQARQEFRGW